MSTTPLSPRQALPQFSRILASGGTFRLVVTGQSMLPFLRHKRDTVLLSPLSGPPRRGDILFYLRGPEACVLHRVHRVRADGTLLMCGDAQTQLEPIRPCQVLARAVQVERGGRTLRCSSPSWRLAGGLWMLLRPIRPHLLALFRRFSLFC